VILRFLREFLEFMVEFLGFFLAPPICSCCSRGVEGKVGGQGEGFLVERWEMDGGAMGGLLPWSGLADVLAMDV
jgi:hypothetical protein